MGILKKAGKKAGKAAGKKVLKAVKGPDTSMGKNWTDRDKDAKNSWSAEGRRSWVARYKAANPPPVPLKERAGEKLLHAASGANQWGEQKKKFNREQRVRRAKMVRTAVKDGMSRRDARAQAAEIYPLSK